MPMGQYVLYEWDPRLWLHILRVQKSAIEQLGKPGKPARMCQHVPPKVVWLSSLLFLFISEVRTLAAAVSAKSARFAHALCKWFGGA